MQCANCKVQGARPHKQRSAWKFLFDSKIYCCKIIQALIFGIHCSDCTDSSRLTDNILTFCTMCRNSLLSNQYMSSDIFICFILFNLSPTADVLYSHHALSPHPCTPASVTLLSHGRANLQKVEQVNFHIRSKVADASCQAPLKSPSTTSP